MNRLRVRLTAGLSAGLLAGGATMLIVPVAHSAAVKTDPYGGIITSSAVTAAVKAGPFKGMTFTVNQTEGLSNQALSVSWTGGTPTSIGNGGKFLSDYVQIMQCWGDPVASPTAPVATGLDSSGSPVTGTDPTNDVTSDNYTLTGGDPKLTNGTDAGPARERCEYGGTPPTTAQVPTADSEFNGSRETAYSWETYGGAAAAYGTAAHPSTFAEIPFDSVTGDVSTQTDSWSSTPPNNSFFDYSTTNEVDGAQTFANGTGHVWFTADTAFEAPGLGCGQTVSDTSSALVPCWLVIVPRNNTEPDGNSLMADDAEDVSGPPLTPEAWANRIAIPLDFNPVASTCRIGADEQETTGSELVDEAMTSWQPVLCQHGGATYGYSANPDEQAREQLSSGGTPLVFTSQPLDASQVPSGGSVTYAPVTLSGISIAFNIDHQTPGQDTGPQLNNLKLTPRLVAKLLTFSYAGAVNAGGNGSGGHVGGLPVGTSSGQGYDWTLKNPSSLFYDPDFAQYNCPADTAGVPDCSSTFFSEEGQAEAATLVVQLGNLDAIKAVWGWIEADPAARAWLAGHPDPWGMVVNPYYSSSRKALSDNPYAANPTGQAFVPDDSFPYNDPYSYTLGGLSEQDGTTEVTSPPLTLLNTYPYANDLITAAQETRAANDASDLTWAPGCTVGSCFSATGPEPTGEDVMLTVTDTVSAERYGLQTASLSAAGDDGPNGNQDNEYTPNFVSPTSGSLLAGATAMKPISRGSAVLWPDPAARGGAYPLTMLAYAATIPAILTKAQLADYSALLRYAAGPGQTSGTGIGQLPPGYVPLPPSLVAQTERAADAIARFTPARASAGSSGGGTPVAKPPGLTEAPGTTSVRPGSGRSSSGSVAGTGAGVGSAAIRLPGVTPAGLASFRYALPVGASAGLLAALLIPLVLGRRATRLLRRPPLPLAVRR